MLIAIGPNAHTLSGLVEYFDKHAGVESFGDELRIDHLRLILQVKDACCLPWRQRGQCLPVLADQFAA